MIQRSFAIIIITIFLHGCTDSISGHDSEALEGKSETENVRPNQSPTTKSIITSDTISKVLVSFMSNINSNYLDHPYSKRIDRISSSRIEIIDLDNPNFNSLIIMHEDINADYFLAEVTVPENFDIQSLNNGWVCSIRNSNDSIEGPLAIYYPNFTKMYKTTYKDGLRENVNVYDSTGGILVHVIAMKCN